MKKIETLLVKYHQENVGTLSLSVDNKLCAFEYDKLWLQEGFSISPLELPLKPGVFLAKSSPFGGNFGIFEDSLPDGYGRYLLHKTVKNKMKEARCREIFEEVRDNCGDLLLSYSLAYRE